MNTLYFWKNWSKEHRIIWFFLGSLFILSLLLLWIYYFMGADAVLDWQKIQEQKVIETTIHSFRLGPFNLSIPSESYVIFEYLGGSNLVHNVFISYLFIGLLAASAVVLLSLITTFDRFWYLVGMGAFTLFLITLRLDVLRLFGLSGYIVPIGALVLYLIPSFYFTYMRPHSGISIRIVVFTLITIAVAVVVAFFSKVASPILHLVVTAYTPALVISTLFIIMIAHEILVSFVYITNQGVSGNNAKHFAIISLIYIVNIIITCLHEVGVVKWNFLYVDIFFLVSISAILGIWGFRLRENLYENIFPFAPTGAWFYMALGIICFITMAQLQGNANDAAIQVIRYVIIFAHTGFGIIFILYFFSNFLGMMGKNIPVHPVLYKPTRMPYFTFRFAGVIASLAFLFYSDWRDFVDHGVAGFYNYVGDMQLAEGNEAFAITFYEKSRSLSFQNNRGNYALATMKSERLNFDDAAYNYRLSNARRPTEYSLANEGNLNFWSGKYFDALKTYRHALEAKPNSGVLQNNMGYAYAKVHHLDSASFLFNRARENKSTKNSAEANFLAMVAAESIPVNADSILKFFNSTDPAVQSNAMAIGHLFRQKVSGIADPLTNKQLNLYTATLLNNYVNYNVKNLDTAFISKAYQIASDSVNNSFSEALKASLAHAYYHQGNVYKAFEILAELAYRTQNYQGKFNYIMGLWSLEQGAAETAASYFTHAETSEYKEARFYRTIALTEAGRVNEAMMGWDSLIAKNDSQTSAIGIRMKRILQAGAAEAMNFSEPEKYQFCRYRLSLKDTVLLSRFVNSFSNNDYKAQTLLDAAKRFYYADNITMAIRLFNQVAGLQLSNEDLYEEIRHFELLMLASRKEVRTLANQINKNVTFTDKYSLQKLLYAGLISEFSGDTVNALKNYDVLSRYNPFFEDGILASSEFFRKYKPEGLKAYNTLVEAIYVNPNSIRLLKAYAAEAARMGFDEYATSATQRWQELQRSKYY